MNPMTGWNGAGINSFALVTYFSGPLSEYLTRLRRELVPDCEAKAHLTVLPPRAIQGAVPDAVRGITQGLQEFSPVYVELGGVEMFAESRVVYVSVTSGRAELERMHDALNVGAVAFDEPFPYHPHITLAQAVSSGFDRGRLGTRPRFLEQVASSPQLRRGGSDHRAEHSQQLLVRRG